MIETKALPAMRKRDLCRRINHYMDILLKKEVMYEHRVSQELVTTWRILITNAGDQLKNPSKGYIRKQERMQ